MKLTIPASLCFDLSNTKVDVIAKLPFQYEASPVLLDVYSIQSQMDQVSERKRVKGNQSISVSEVDEESAVKTIPEEHHIPTL